MAFADNKVIAKMQGRVDAWEQAADARAIFLRCYLMMTQNMLAAIERREFNDLAWVERLLNRFADYYFVALDAYDVDPDTAPAIWHFVFRETAEPVCISLQKLLLGVNAHINYDLVLTLVDLLEHEWGVLSDDQRKQRYEDHCAVNEVIGRTIDAVQDQVLEPSQPALDFIDKLFGPLDEIMISRLISKWRESVWQSAIKLLNAPDQDMRSQIICDIEDSAMRKANILGAQNLGSALREIW